MQKLRTNLALRIILFLIGVASWIIAIDWILEDFSHEPLLALMGGTAALISSYVIRDNSSKQDSGIAMDNLSSRNNLYRQTAIKSVQSLWIDGYLKSSLRNLSKIDLHYESVADALTNSENPHKFPNLQSFQSSLKASNIVDIYRKSGNSR